MKEKAHVLETRIGLLLRCSALAGSPAEEAKRQAFARLEGMGKLAPGDGDTVFGYGEPGYQEIEDVAESDGVLHDTTLRSETGVAGIPTAWVASWGRWQTGNWNDGDIDALLGVSQKPGVPYQASLIAGRAGAWRRDTTPVSR